jgi:predicted TIM-barrel fold metal-dependent hydrolase
MKSHHDQCVVASRGPGQHEHNDEAYQSSRREFLTALAAAVAASRVLRGSALTAPTPAGGGTPHFHPGFHTSAHKTRAADPGLIDLHHRIWPPISVTGTRRRIIAKGHTGLRALVVPWTPESTLAEMDGGGVATTIVSISMPGGGFGDVEADRRLMRACNEYAAGLARDYPHRFGFFAAVPLADTEGSLREIEYALDVLKADGIGLMTSYGVRWPGDRTFAPVLEELNRRAAVVSVHPPGPSCCREMIHYVPHPASELSRETTRAMTSLLAARAFARFRNIRFIFSHAHETLPMVARRLAREGTAAAPIVEEVRSGVDYESKRLYYDIAGSANRPAIAALRRSVPTSQILFGSDYPRGHIGMPASAAANLGLSVDDLRGVGRENAVALFARMHA